MYQKLHRRFIPSMGIIALALALVVIFSASTPIEAQDRSERIPAGAPGSTVASTARVTHTPTVAHVAESVDDLGHPTLPEVEVVISISAHRLIAALRFS
jgi:hypothetical protein